ncbi:hypothetical protein CW354_04790 [Marinicaulis flavus]|uniref:SH3b domain-containing protein n=2 Tax=Hyphococcus luteus TaxID=2058213 RepID=A0A2S7K9S5_9PROT|nr:hypothetical protein CW354_04790 [Marinicaulis flavus]
MVAASFLLAQTPSARAADCAQESPRDKKAYTSAAVNLRGAPSTYGDILAALPEGQTVYAFGSYGDWSRVNVAALNVAGYIATRYISDECIEGREIARADLSNANIVAILLSQSQSRYSGSCPCPFYSDRAGRRCGARSAYSRPGGASPLCYKSDVTDAMIRSFRAEL